MIVGGTLKKRKLIPLHLKWSLISHSWQRIRFNGNCPHSLLGNLFQPMTTLFIKILFVIIPRFTADRLMHLNGDISDLGARRNFGRKWCISNKKKKQKKRRRQCRICLRVIFARPVYSRVTLLRIAQMKIAAVINSTLSYILGDVVVGIQWHTDKIVTRLGVLSLQ